MDFSNFKCRCSGIYKIMASSRANPVLTENQVVELRGFREKLDAGGTLTPKQQEKMAELIVKEGNGSKIVLSDGAIDYLLEQYALITQDMVSVKKELGFIDQMQNGSLVEEESITLLSVVEGELYAKNTENVENDYLKGEPDVFIGDEIMKATKITDIKSCFDYPSFLQKIKKELDDGWEIQVQGYCDITGAPVGEVAHCLVNVHPMLIGDMKIRLLRKLDCATEESPEFKRVWQKIYKSMIFDGIPPHLRVFRVPVTPFSPELKQKVYDRVKVCREWLNIFSEEYQVMNK